MKQLSLIATGIFLTCSTMIAVGPPPRPAASVLKPVRAFLESHCIDCHSADSKKGGLDLNSLPTRLSTAALEAKWTLIYDRVACGEMPPPRKAQRPTKERDAFLTSLGNSLKQHDRIRQARTGRVPLRRLNRVEYENSLHDLLGIDIPLAELLPEDGSAHGFDNVAEALRLSPSQIEAYLLAADKALDAALKVGPKPPSKKQRFSYLKLPNVKESLARPHGSLNKDGSKHQQLYRALPDAFVMFTNESYGMTTLRESRTPSRDRYRVRLSAYAHQSKGRPTVVAKVMATNFVSSHLIGSFDMPVDKPRLVEFTVHLEEGELLYLSASGCGIAPDGTDAQTVGAEKFTGPGLAIQWVEIEGPLPEAWPPPSIRRVYGELPVKPLDKKQPTGRAYEVVVSHPAKDAKKVVEGFAARAFRRSVTGEETARYTQLAVKALADGATFENAVRCGCKAVLTSPEFLFLQEGVGKLDDYALASRLSYFLWSTMPDNELLRLAGQKKLHDPATLRAQTSRLLASPKAHAFTSNFCGQWLNLRTIDATTPDRQLYPEFDDLLKHAMVAETESFFDEMLRGNLGAATLIDSDFAMLNRRLAEHYGIAGVKGEQFRKVKLPKGSHRGGVLTQASILKVTANGTLSSPVVRGAWVMKHLLGRDPQPPPADAGAIEPDTRGTTTIREQLEKHRRSASCAVCHKHMDPPGLALESFDVIGGWREFYRSQGKGKPVIDPETKRHREYRQGPPVDPSGELANGQKFANIDEFKAILLGQREAVARNLVNNLVTYATGAGVTFADREKVEAILRTARPHSYGLRTLVHEIVQSPLFQSK